jgi:hypothetical protein
MPFEPIPELKRAELWQPKKFHIGDSLLLAHMNLRTMGFDQPDANLKAVLDKFSADQKTKGEKFAADFKSNMEAFSEDVKVRGEKLAAQASGDRFFQDVKSRLEAFTANAKNRAEKLAGEAKAKAEKLIADINKAAANLTITGKVNNLDKTD